MKIQKMSKRVPAPKKAPEQSKNIKIKLPEINSLKPKWSFARIDWHSALLELSVNQCKSGEVLSSASLKVEACFHIISEKLKSFESMTWGEIIKNGSHYIKLDNLKNVNYSFYKKFRAIAHCCPK